MERTKDFLSGHLKKIRTRPFLFVGSGLSLRYLNMDTWENLLKKFALPLKDFEYYLAASDSKLPRTASLISKDFTEYWWTSAETASERNKYKAIVKKSSSPLKIAISNYVESMSSFNLSTSPYQSEIRALSSIAVDGIITTNWDKFLETIFPTYKVFIGQQSIVTQVPQNIGEIYKIHGCCTEPESLVLTEEDLFEFNFKQTYLAAKLITIFVEHPIIFFGYSVNDPNISSMLKAIVRGLGKSELDKMRDNLIFIMRSKTDRPPGVKETSLVIDDVQISVTQIIEDSFEEVYNVIGEQKPQLPVSVLRFCREQIYQIAYDSEPNKKLCLANIEDIENHKDIEFVIGVGIVKPQYSEIGYKPIESGMLFDFLLDENKGIIDPTLVLKNTLSKNQANRRFLPVYCFLKSIGISNGTELARSGFQLGSLVQRNFSAFAYDAYEKQYNSNCESLSTSQIIDKFPPNTAVVLLPHQPAGTIDKVALKKFLLDNKDKLVQKNGYQTHYRRLACLYDKIVYGW